MRRHLDLTDIWQRTGLDMKDSLGLEMDGTTKTAELFWSVVIGMAMKDGAWCIRYHLHDGDRTCVLSYFTDWVGYGLIPPPDEMADLLIRGLHTLTCSRGPSGVFAWLRTLCGGRITRAFDVTYDGHRVSWVASWPARASGGAIVLFRGQVTDRKPLGRGTAGSSESRDEVSDPHRNGG